jgi:hypothetical protein
MIFFHLKIVIEAPLAAGDDDIIYLGISQNIIDDHGIKYDKNDIEYYKFTPSLFLLIDTMSFMGNNSIVLASTILIFIQLIATSCLAFLICRYLLASQWLSLITTILFITHGDQLNYEQYNFASFSLLRTGQFSFIVFLLCIYLVLKLLKLNKIKTLFLILPITIAIILYHHQSGVINWVIFYLFLVLTMFIRYKKHSLKQIFSYILIMAFIASIPVITLFLLNFFWKGKIINTVLSLLSSAITGGITEEVNIFAINYFHLLGGITLIGGIFGLGYLIKFRKQYQIPLILLLSILTILFLGTYQSMVSFHFFPRRFLAGLHFPAEILCGFLLYYFWQYRKKMLFISFTTIIIISGLSNYFYSLNNVHLDLNWKYISATEWAKNNLNRDEKFVSDVLTIIQFDQLANLQPAYQYPRVKDYQQINSKEEIQKIFVEEDVIAANEYLKKNKIKYVIIDTKNSPFWTPGNYKKFNNQDYFKEIYSQKIDDNQKIIIYETI